MTWVLLVMWFTENGSIISSEDRGHYISVEQCEVAAKYLRENSSSSGVLRFVCIPQSPRGDSHD